MELKDTKEGAIYKVKKVRDLDSLEVGDYIATQTSKKLDSLYEVMGVCGKVVFLMKKGGVDDVLTLPIDWLKDKGYKLIQPEEEPKETLLTLQEIADKFGIDIENLRLKKE